jgi:hypothetical protein
MSFFTVMVDWDVPSITQNAWPAIYLITLKINYTVQTVTTLIIKNPKSECLTKYVPAGMSI